MDSEALRTPGSAKLKRNLDQKAVNLAFHGEWEGATEVNKAILELFPNEVEAMNRLVKALIELGNFMEARVVLDRAYETAPYNSIAKKNRARLDQLAASPGSFNPGAGKQAQKSAGTPHMFIEESGKSGTTVLRNTGGNRAVVHVSPSDRVVLSPEKNTVTVRTLDGHVLGQVELRLGKRLAGLMDGGNKYTAAVVAVSDEGVSVIIQETFKHRSLQNICSFPTKVKEEDRIFRNEAVARLMREEDPDDDDEEENVIDEEEMDTGWLDDE